MSLILLALLAAVAAGEQAAPADQARFTGSAAYSALRRSGREVVAEKTLDLDADGRIDALVVSRSDDGMELSAYRNSAEAGFELLSRSAPLAGEEMARFEALDLAGRRGFVLDVLEDSPDEADHHLALFVANPAGLAQVLTTGWRQKHSEEDAGRQAEEVIDLGGVEEGVSIAQRGDGGWPNVSLRYNPKAVLFSGQSGQPVRVVIGIRTRRFRFNAGRYDEAFDGFSAFLEPVQGLTAGAGQERQVVDGVITTGWKATKLPGKLAASWPKSVPVRVVGIADCPERPAGIGKVRKLSLTIGDAQPVTVDLDQPAGVDARVAGVGSYVLGRGVQALVFLREPIRGARLEIVVEGVTDGGTGFCLAELTPFAAKVDRKPTSSASSTPP